MPVSRRVAVSQARQAATRAAAAPLVVAVSRDACARPRGVPAAPTLRRWIAMAAGGRVRRPTELAVRIVGRAEARRLNRNFRGRDYATNVLSFEAPRRYAGMLGDIVICAPLVAREAREQGKPLRSHWAHLVIHGTLHLLGFDHLRAGDARRMERREVRLLQTLGIVNPYD
jgi:probable rRNA maturation factor